MLLFEAWQGEQPEGDDGVGSYQELYRLGLIDAFGYYRDMASTGMDFEEYRLVPEDEFRFEASGLGDEGKDQMADAMESLAIQHPVRDFRFVGLPKDSFRVEAVFGNGDLLRFQWDGVWRDFKWAEFNGQRLSGPELEEAGRQVAYQPGGANYLGDEGTAYLIADILYGLLPGDYYE